MGWFHDSKRVQLAARTNEMETFITPHYEAFKPKLDPPIQQQRSELVWTRRNPTAWARWHR